MNKITKQLWGREFTLYFVFQTFGDDEETAEQRLALQEFVSSQVDDDSLRRVKEYVLNHDGINEGIDEIENIFKYVMPKSIYVPKSKEHIVAIICDYRFDREHGLAVVFENGLISQVGKEDIVL